MVFVEALVMGVVACAFTERKKMCVCVCVWVCVYVCVFDIPL